ncbi:MAG: efflux RND transporter periplasmic adaptor subunit [Cryomorphaceae bacterium]|nr:HlyD family efflux transporter periplasmic adaptor subunit [Flavobacteriales bacterium]
MKKRQIIIILIGVGILAASILLSGMLTKEKPEQKDKADLKTAVKAREMETGEVKRTVRITGRLVPEKEITVFAEVGGVATFGVRPFKVGANFKKGEIMIRINSDEIQSALIAGRSNFQSLLAGIIPDLKTDFPDVAETWESYLFDMEIDENLPPLPEIESKKLKLFLSGRQVFSNYYNIRENETRLAKFNIRAPFSGSLVSASLDEGSLVRVGQPLGEFISSGSFELESGISYSDVQYLSPGTEFTARDVNAGREFKAIVVRVSDRVDPQTQQVKIFSRIASSDARSGIYLEGDIPAETFDDANEIPIDALVGNDGVFTISDSTATLQKVDVEYKNNEIAIVSGLPERAKIIVDKHNESLNGSTVSAVNLNE